MDDLATRPSSYEPMPPPSAAISPSASATTVVNNDDRPQKVITVAMLRALSKSVLRKNRPGA